MQTTEKTSSSCNLVLRFFMVALLNIVN